MATGAQIEEWDRPSRRRGLRYRLQAPMEVTVLRSGIPDTLPGRSVDVGEGGVAGVLAGELMPGEAVGVEIRMSAAADALRTRALVRHYDKLRVGMEFVSLSREQQAALRNWLGSSTSKTETSGIVKSAADGDGNSNIKDKGNGGSGGAQFPVKRPWRGPKRTYVLLTAFLVSAAILLGVLWWRWNRGWEDLESKLQQNGAKTEVQRPQARVAAEVMEGRVRHRVDPEYPEAARQEKLRGVIVLDVVIGRDGTVVDVHAQNGPEVLARAAMDAMRWWRFEPYRVEGQPAVVETTVAMEFKP